MIHKASQLIKDGFTEAGIKCRDIEENGNISFVEAGTFIDNGPSVFIRFISPDENNDVGVCLLGLIHVRDEEKIPRLLEAVNQCNSKFKFLKCYLDKDNDLNVRYDIPVRTTDECLGSVAANVFRKMQMFLDKSYPILMKALWDESDDETEDED